MKIKIYIIIWYSAENFCFIIFFFKLLYKKDYGQIYLKMQFTCCFRLDNIIFHNLKISRCVAPSRQVLLRCGKKRIRGQNSHSSAFLGGNSTVIGLPEYQGVATPIKVWKKFKKSFRRITTEEFTFCKICVLVNICVVDIY